MCKSLQFVVFHHNGHGFFGIVTNTTKETNMGFFKRSDDLLLKKSFLVVQLAKVKK